MAVTPEAALVYVGIAVVRVAAPVYARPSAEAENVGSVQAGGYVPHFRATDDHAWLEVTLHNGSTGWLRNDPAKVVVNLPDPTKLRVCVDPGHGGSEAGARGFGLKESDINLDIASRMYPLLADTRGIDRIWYTRTGDYDVSLRYRWDLANASFAALFVSIHNNASEDPTLRGTETYYKCGAEGTDWLRAASARAACLVHTGLRDRIWQFNNPDCPWVDRGVICRLVSEEDPRSYYFVLQNTNVPAILTECMYITNQGDATCLGMPRFREHLAGGIYQGVMEALFGTLPGKECDFRTLYGL